ncbi:D-alanine--D-alanine ligase [bacterium]|nr:D-alanine--D-alanine ligase [bacterium]
MDIKKYFQDKRIGIIMGGWSQEREVSLETGKAVKKALIEEGMNVLAIDVDRNEFTTKLKEEKIDYVFIALHGTFGEDGTVQAILELMGLPYSGSGVLCSALAMNKVFSKCFLSFNNIPTPEYKVVKKGDILQDLDLKLPVIVKPSMQGSAVGITKVLEIKDLYAALNRAFQYGSEVVIERYIQGKEISVGILGEIVLPVIEIVPKGDFYDYEAKYVPGMSSHILPAALDEITYNKAQQYAKKVYSGFNCRGAARVDMMVDDKNEIYVLEVNTIPGMTPTSLLPEEAKAAGINFNQLILKIIELSIVEKQARH